MKTDQNRGTFGFRFNEQPHLPLCYLFAVGNECVHDCSYHWDGLVRSDGPLLLFQYTTSGEGVFETGEDSYRVPQGRAFLAEIPDNHRYYHPGGKQPWEFYFLLIRPGLILPLWEQIKASKGPVPFLDSGSIPIRMLRDIFAEAQAGRITDPYLASSYVYQFITELSRASATTNRNKDGWPDSIQEAVQFMDANYFRMIGQDQLAEKLKLSKFHLLRTFTKYVGVTPNDYLNRIRMEKSIELLRTTDWSIERIGTAVGYSTGSYFIKVFHKFTGQTPGSFRSGNHSLHYNRLFFD
ncbi:AraC family transcriptional regulator [Cohnella endophytica]|uniref:AraC family transcriptional regulator n=1 Tax=Cohnella endophytica TaxID=2419778 RepID=A0A494YBK0_9BACL|nr:AraC family transcriptional regulator [Cohnella endophytica]RKP57332.1 AraC family transcriptional regulator [Cohnella endophytica]